MKEETAQRLILVLAQTDEIVSDLWLKIAAMEDVLKKNPEMYATYQERLRAWKDANRAAAEGRPSRFEELRKALTQDRD